MNQRTKLIFTSYIVLSLFVFCLLAGTATYYATLAPNKRIPLLPKNTPFSEFIIGRWKSINVVEKGVPREGDSWYELEIRPDGTLRFENHTIEEYNHSGFTGRYSFIEPDTILVTDSRTPKGDKWVLERDGQDLIVVIDPNNVNLTIVFTRIESR